MTNMKQVRVYDANGQECVAYQETTGFDQAAYLARFIFRVYCWACLLGIIGFAIITVLATNNII